MTYRSTPARYATVAGLIAGAAAVSSAELVAGLVPGAPSLIVAMGDLLIALQPPGAKEWIVGLFGTNDKLAVNLVVLGVALAIGATLGVIARLRWRTAVAGFVAVGALLVAASAREPLVSPGWAFVAPCGATILAIWLLHRLLRLGRPAESDAERQGTTRDRSPVRPASGSGALAAMPDWRRRRFLISSAGLAVASLAASATGRRLLDGRALAQGRAATSPGASGPAGLPFPEATAAPITTGSSFDLPGITPLVVPNAEFYRIDTALIVPNVDVTSWTVTVRGMVDRVVELSYSDLLALPNFEQFVTIACVSNEVGGDLVGNAKWQGVHLRDVLAMAGVHPGATQLVGRSVDGFTVGFPTSWAMDKSRDPMIAVGMNGQRLPVEHGFPARLIVPGLYGYVSATKWLKEIELTTLEAFDAYWVPLGWAKQAPILTQSRIDVPRNGQRIPAGTVAVGGVAWAPDRGVSKVEVRVNGGAWGPATMSTPLSDDTWVQWRFDWPATATGIFDLTVRATDGKGTVQAEQSTPPAPDGARGHHRISVEIR